MIDFEKRKEKNVLNSKIHQEECLLNTEQSKFIYEISINNNNQIKDIQKEIHILKTQMCDILNIFNNKSIINKFKNKNNKTFVKEEKKIEDDNNILEYINKEVRIQLNDKMDVLNDKLNIFNENYKLELDNEIEIMKNELLNHEKLIMSLKNNKLERTDFEENINIINNNFDKINEKVILSQLEKKEIENDIKNKNKSSYLDIKDLKKIKQEIYADFEKINLKILNELKNQAYDIKSLYQELQSNSKDNLKNVLTTEEDISTENIYHNNKIINSIYKIEKELEKKVNLEQLNFALSAQSKLNEALNSTSQLCRMCWDSEGILLNNKYIQWSSQNINTALNIFKWETNSENILILQKGVYKIVVGLIGLESDKYIKIYFNDYNQNEETINDFENNDIRNPNNYNTIDWNSGNDKGNVVFIEKYFACVENTEIKVCLIDNENNNKDTSEEAFLELNKII